MLLSCTMISFSFCHASTTIVSEQLALSQNFTNYLKYYLHLFEIFPLQILDADKGERLESSTGRIASRDIVQFVPLKDVQSKQLTLCCMNQLKQGISQLFSAGGNIPFLCRWRAFCCSSTSSRIALSIFNLHASQGYPTKYLICINHVHMKSTFLLLVFISCQEFAVISVFMPMPQVFQVF